MNTSANELMIAISACHLNDMQPNIMNYLGKITIRHRFYKFEIIFFLKVVPTFLNGTFSWSILFISTINVQLDLDPGLFSGHVTGVTYLSWKKVLISFALWRITALKNNFIIAEIIFILRQLSNSSMYTSTFMVKVMTSKQYLFNHWTF